jgi:hypothetical protein
MAEDETTSELVIALLCLPILAGVYSLVASQLWKWFLVPLGLPVISLALIYGLSTFVRLVTVQSFSSTGKALSNLGNAVTYCLISLLFGYIAHRIMVG